MELKLKNGFHVSGLSGRMMDFVFKRFCSRNGSHLTLTAVWFIKLLNIYPSLVFGSLSLSLTSLFRWPPIMCTWLCKVIVMWLWRSPDSTIWARTLPPPHRCWAWEWTASTLLSDLLISGSVSLGKLHILKLLQAIIILWWQNGSQIHWLSTYFLSNGYSRNVVGKSSVIFIVLSATVYLIAC